MLAPLSAHVRLVLRLVIKFLSSAVRALRHSTPATLPFRGALIFIQELTNILIIALMLTLPFVRLGSHIRIIARPQLRFDLLSRRSLLIVRCSMRLILLRQVVQMILLSRSHLHLPRLVKVFNGDLASLFVHTATFVHVLDQWWAIQLNLLRMKWLITVATNLF